MGLEIKKEMTQQNYEDTLRMWGEHDEDAPQQYKEYSKASRDYVRLLGAIKRDTPNVEGWEVLD